MQTLKISAIKRIAHQLSNSLKNDDINLPQSKILNLLSNFYGFKNWNAFVGKEAKTNIFSDFVSVLHGSNDILIDSQKIYKGLLDKGYEKIMTEENHSDFLFQTRFGGDFNSYKNSKGVNSEKETKELKDFHPYRANLLFCNVDHINLNEILFLSNKNTIIDGLTINEMEFLSGKGSVDTTIFIKPEITKIAKFLAEKTTSLSEFKIKKIIENILNDRIEFNLNNYSINETFNYIVFESNAINEKRSITVLKNIKENQINKDSICYIDNFNRDFVINEQRHFIVNNKNNNDPICFYIDKENCFFNIGKYKKIKINKMFQLFKNQKQSDYYNFYNTKDFLEKYSNKNKTNTFDLFVLDEKRKIIEIMIKDDAYLFYF